LNWGGLDPNDIEPIYEAWQALPEPQRAEIERWFRAVWALASKEGLRTVIEEGRFHDLDLKASLDQWPGLHEKMFGFISIIRGSSCPPTA